MKLLSLYCCLIPILPIFGYEYELSVCTMFQNEADYLEEWIEYHKKMGVEHFWLYSNNSTDHYLTELQPYIDTGLVELIEWPSPEVSKNAVKHFLVRQNSAFTDALFKAKNCSKWLAAIDVDEFIVPVSGKTIPDVLNNRIFKDAHAIYVNWVMYGTSNVERCPKGELLKTLLYRAETNFQRNHECKSIIRTQYAQNFSNPHFANLERNSHYVDGRGGSVDPQKRKGVHINHLRINHYWARDRNFMNNVKIPQQLKWGNNPSSVIEHEKGMNEIFDPIILQYL